MEAYFGTLEDFQGQIGAVPRGITDLAGLYWMSTIPIDNSPETQEVYKQYQSLLDTGFLDVT